jgi:putative sporulation protein YtxC
MTSFCIKTNNKSDIKFLMNSIRVMNFDNIFFTCKKFSKYTNIIVHYLGNNTSDFYNELSKVICDCILANYEKKIIHTLILMNYFYFDDSDLITIENNCSNYLCENFSNKNQLLWCDIVKYVIDNKYMVLEGFIQFRIFNYVKLIDSAIDFSVNDFIIHREYVEFVDLLKAYIKSQPSKVKLVHLVYINDEAILLDENYNVISLTHTNLQISYLSDISFSANDYVLNSLLYLLPKNIIIHLDKPEDDFINTLKLIFENSVSIYDDCKFIKEKMWHD